MKYANLHLHSNFSDAQFTPEQLVLIGKSLGYKAIAITDHETDGAVDRLFSYAKEQHFEAMVGCEFYGKHDGHTLHLTALNYDYNSPAIRSFIKERCELRAEFTKKSFDRGVSLGIITDLTWNDVLDTAPNSSWICIDSIFNAFRAKRIPIPDNLRDECFKAPEIKAQTPPHPTAEEVIKVVRKANGIVALAHPYNVTHYVPELVEFGLNGIEVSHPSNFENTSALADTAAKVYNLYRCGGTDHTGPMSGCAGKHARPAFHGVTEEEYVTIKERRLG